MVEKRGIQAFLNSAWCQDKRQRAEIKTPEIPSELKKTLFYCEFGKTLVCCAEML